MRVPLTTIIITMFSQPVDQAEGQPLLGGDSRGARCTIAEHAIEIASRSLAVRVLRLVISFCAIARVAPNIGAGLCHRHHFHNAFNSPERRDVNRGMLLACGVLWRDQHEIANKVLV